MFKNIQNKLIFTHPLIWNIKLIPMLIVLGIFHLFVFAIGFFHGIIDLEYSFLPYEYQDVSFIIMTSLVMFLIFILWIYYYMRNNAFENFYPKKAFDIYKEWLMIFLIIFLIVGFPITYFFGKETKIRSYISKEELLKEIDVIEKASLFMKSEYNLLDYKYIKDYETMQEIPDSLVTDNSIKVVRDTIKFNSKSYPYYSIFNKHINSINELNNLEIDSLKERKIKLLLQNDDKIAIKNILNDYLNIQKKYKHKHNLTAEKWMELIYNYPNFEEKIFVGQFKNSEFDNYNYNDGYVDTAPIVSDNQLNDTINKNMEYHKIFENSIIHYRKNTLEYFKYKHYTDDAHTRKLINIYTDAYNNKDCNFGLILGLFYFAGFLSLVLFLYKMIQWKNWLLTIVSGIVISIVVGIIVLLIDEFFRFRKEEVIILGIYLLVFSSIITLFIFFIYKKTTKKISGILLGLTQAIVPLFLVVLLLFLLEATKEFSGYNYENENTFGTINKKVAYPWVCIFEELKDLLVILNILFVFIIMYPMSIWIKKWKSLPEA